MNIETIAILLFISLMGKGIKMNTVEIKRTCMSTGKILVHVLKGEQVFDLGPDLGLIHLNIRRIQRMKRPLSCDLRELPSLLVKRNEMVDKLLSLNAISASEYEAGKKSAILAPEVKSTVEFVEKDTQIEVLWVKWHQNPLDSSGMSTDLKDWLE